MRILVTGGSGLVGSALNRLSTRYSHHEWLFMSSRECDLTDFEKTCNLFASFNPDVIIHLAAAVGGLFKNMNNKVEMLEKNLLINLNVLRAAHTNNVNRLIACLSTCVFPDKTSYPIDETMLHNGPPHTSNDAYAYAKRLLEVQCRAYQENHDREYICIIPTNIYGPEDNFSLTDAHVIPALIHKCYLAKRDGTPFTICGSGKPLRQFIHSDDLAKLIVWVINHYKQREPIILSVDEEEEVSINHVATIIAKKFGLELTNDPSYSDGQFKKTASNRKLREFLPEYKFIPIEEGIETVCDWFTNNYNRARR